MIQRLEYSVVTKGSRDLAWKIFSDHTRWPTFSDIYKDIRWVYGEPWATGSRMRIEVDRPIRATIDHVIIGCSPSEKVGWIDHALGVTMEQWVVFESRAQGGTQVRTWGEFTGSLPQVAGVAIKPFLEGFIQKWYGNYRDACDQAADVNPPPSPVVLG